MDLTAIFKVLGPALVSFVENMVGNLKTPAPPVVVPDTGVVPAGAMTASDHAMIKAFQDLLNKAMNPIPPLMVDGWLGPLTDKVAMEGIAKIKAALGI